MTIGNEFREQLSHNYGFNMQIGTKTIWDPSKLPHDIQAELVNEFQKPITELYTHNQGELFEYISMIMQDTLRMVRKEARKAGNTAEVENARQASELLEAALPKVLQLDKNSVEQSQRIAKVFADLKALYHL